MAQAITEQNEKQVLDQLKNTNIEGHLNDRIPKKLLTENNIADKFKWTSVIDRACRYSSLKISRALVLAGASVHHVNNRGDSALHSICWTRKEKMEKFCFLFEFDKDLIHYLNREQKSCLHYTAYNNDMDMCIALLKHGADIHARDFEGATCFHYAATGNNVQVMDLLMEHGAHLDTCSDNGTRPIHNSAYNGNTEALVYLLEKGVDIDCPTLDDIKSGPLHYASQGGQVECAKELLKRGANVKLRNKNGN